MASTYSRSRGGEENEATEVSSALVAQSAGGVEQGTDTVALEGSSDEGGAEANGGRGGLLGADKLLVGVGGLVAVVGGAEDGGQDGELNALVEGQAEGNGRGLDGGEVCGSQSVAAFTSSRRCLCMLWQSLGKEGGIRTLQRHCGLLSLKMELR